jgi:hypothetical protein
MSLLEEIQRLLTAPTSGPDAPDLADVEHTLTTGYARVLSLEAERQRLERRLGQSDAGDVAAVTERMAAAAAEVSRLRSLLEPLRERASTLRARGEPLILPDGLGEIPAASTSA